MRFISTLAIFAASAYAQEADTTSVIINWSDSEFESLYENWDEERESIDEAWEEFEGSAMRGY